MNNYIDYGYDYKITKKVTEDGAEVYYAEFIDGEGQKQVVRVEKEVADAIMESQREEALARRQSRKYCVSLEDNEGRLGYLDVYPSLVENEELTNSQKVRKVLSMMKPNQAEILKKVFFENKNQQEIAKEYGISQPGVCGRLERAKERFKKIFFELFGEKPL